MNKTRKMAEQAQKFANALFALADAEDKEIKAQSKVLQKTFFLKR